MVLDALSEERNGNADRVVRVPPVSCPSSLGFSLPRKVPMKR
jgi:hypothetical protein